MSDKTPKTDISNTERPVGDEVVQSTIDTDKNSIQTNEIKEETNTTDVDATAKKNDGIKYTVELLAVSGNFYLINKKEEPVSAAEVENAIVGKTLVKRGASSITTENSNKVGGKKTATKKYHKPYPKNVTFSKKNPKKKHNKKTIRKLQNALNNMLL